MLKDISIVTKGTFHSDVFKVFLRAWKPQESNQLVAASGRQMENYKTSRNYWNLYQLKDILAVTKGALHSDVFSVFLGAWGSFWNQINLQMPVKERWKQYRTSRNCWNLFRLKDILAVTKGACIPSDLVSAQATTISQLTTFEEIASKTNPRSSPESRKTR